MVLVCHITGLRYGDLAMFVPGLFVFPIPFDARTFGENAIKIQELVGGSNLSDRIVILIARSLLAWRI